MFGALTAVDCLDIAIRRGEVVALLGPNGAGKTSTLDMIVGLSRPTDGYVEVLGGTPRSSVDQGWLTEVTQSGGLVSDMTVFEHVRVMADLFGYPAQRAREVVAEVGLADRASRKVKVCSGGERQRVKFAMALVSTPQVLILDEPTTGMDVAVRHQFWAQIHAEAERGCTIIFATHYLEEADQYSDRVIMMAKGRVVADGPTAQVRALVAGEVVSCRFADIASAEAAVSLIDDLADHVERQAAGLTIATTRSDEVLERLIMADTGATDFRVADRGIEDAFISLTEARAS
jgi:ABC-2 type transport system ATP-binding protein